MHFVVSLYNRRVHRDENAPACTGAAASLPALCFPLFTLGANKKSNESGPSSDSDSDADAANSRCDFPSTARTSAVRVGFGGAGRTGESAMSTMMTF